MAHFISTPTIIILKGFLNPPKTNPKTLVLISVNHFTKRLFLNLPVLYMENLILSLFLKKRTKKKSVSFKK